MTSFTKSKILVLVQFLLIGVIGWYSGFYGGVTTNILMTLGILLGIWAVVAMRFSVNIFPDVRDNQHLVIRGPYKWIRHPMYTSVLLVTLAWVINRPDTVSALLWILLFTDLLIKTNYEENLLVKRFPKYSEYKTTVHALVPFI